MRARRLMPTEVAEYLAKKTGMTSEQVKSFLTAQAEAAYEHAKEGFNIPGVGVFTTMSIPERRMVMQFGPKAGEEIVVPARHKIKFHVARAAKESLARPAQPRPDLFKAVT